MRYYFLDALRSTLMMLGVVYHASMIYSGYLWRVTDPSPHPGPFNAFIEAEKIFRMPAFFAIAGFFTMLSLGRHGTAGFLKNRAMRILVPLVAATFTINAAMVYLNPVSGGIEPLAAFLRRIPALAAYGNLNAHLWFLHYLFAYYLLFIGLRWAAARLGWSDGVKRFAQGAPGRISDPSLLIFVLALAQAGLWVFSNRYPEIALARILRTPFEINRFLHLFSFFVLGAWMFADRRMLDGFTRLRAWHLAAFAFAVVVMCGARWTPEITARNIFFGWLEGFLTWMSVLFCFAVFRLCCDRPSRLWAYFSDASYSIYLFHQLFVVLFGLALRGSGLPAPAKFTLVVMLTLGITLAIHHFLILRFRPLRLLYNGK